MANKSPVQPLAVPVNNARQALSPTTILSSPAISRLVFIVSCLAVLASPFVYIGNYAGDSQVHLIYGENAARGRFFEFNPGEKSPGVTSPGYMLFIAGLFTLTPDWVVPALVKATNLLFWYALLLVVFLIAKRLLGSPVWASMAMLVAGLLPGSVYNSTIGMENGIFAFVTFLWIYLSIGNRWFVAASSSRGTIRWELAMGFLLGVACWIRPEGFIIAALVLSYRGFRSLGSRPIFFSTMSRSIAFLAPFVLVTGGLAYFHYFHTGFLLPVSGLSRIFLSSLASDSFALGPIFFSSKLAVRLAQYFPLTVLFLLANWLVFTRRGSPRESNGGLGFLLVLFWTAFVLHSTVMGSLHLARYVIYAMPAMVLVAMVAGHAAWNWRVQAGGLWLHHAPRVAMVALALALLGVFTLETNLRLGLDSQASLWKSMKAPSQRTAFSDALYLQLQQPQSLPISIALQEVQARYWLDDRFVVRSLDGRTDPELLKHTTRDGVEHIGYLRELRVQFLLDTPAYTRDPQAWSLKRLNRLGPGESLVREGLSFSRLPISRPARQPTGSGGFADLRWFAGADAVNVLQFFLQELIRIDYGTTEDSQ